MNSFDYYSPTHFVFGKDREKETSKYIKKYGGNNVLIIYFDFVKKIGLLDKITESFGKENLHYIEYDEIGENPTSSMIYKGIELCKENDIDFILAIGGGSTIDTAKAIAMGVPYSGDFWDFFSGKAPEEALPIGVVLTNAASGSEGSPNAIVTNEETLEKNAAESDLIRPKFTIMNPELTMTLSPYQTACGITDIFSHCIERYFSNTEEVGLTDRMLESVMATLISEAPKVMKNPKDYGSRSNIMWAGMVAHNDIMGVGREQDWNSHHLEHVLSAKYGCVHGAGMAVIMPAWMRFVVERHGVMKFAQFANRVFGIEVDFDNPYNTAIKGITMLEDFFLDLGMPLNFKDLNIPDDEIDVLVELNRLGNEKTKGFYHMNNDDLKEIYEIAAKNRL